MEGAKLHNYSLIQHTVLLRQPFEPILNKTDLFIFSTCDKNPARPVAQGKAVDS